ELHSAALFVPSGTKQDFGDIESIPLDQDAAVDAVIIGDLGEAWDFRSLNRAFGFLMQDPAPRLIALGMTRYWRGRGGLQLDVAPFVKALEHAASCEAVVVGKPAAAFFESSLASLGCSAGQTLMIGDDIVGDIDAAQRCGIRGIQVRTGKFRDADLGGAIKPYVVLDSFADLPAWWAESVTES
ncbi:MAG: HAD hydrolase-like protein, partial [Gammaproteobacteria bacterium]|nr:HAD hydrolase-like protein [Gammaproteobacteria bacterium]